MLHSDYIDRLPSNGFFLFNDKYFEAKIVTIHFSLNFNGNNYPLCVNKVTKSFFDKYICSFCYYKEKISQFQQDFRPYPKRIVKKALLMKMHSQEGLFPI